MKWLLSLPLLTLLSGCASIDSKISSVPGVGFDVVLLSRTQANPTDKVTFSIESSGTDLWLTVQNGTKEFIQFKNLNLAGSRCSYVSRGKTAVAPENVSTFKMPTLGLLGLCFSNEDQMKLITMPFESVSSKQTSTEYLPTYFSVDYYSPAKNTKGQGHISYQLFLNFKRTELQ